MIATKLTQNQLNRFQRWVIAVLIASLSLFQSATAGGSLQVTAPASDSLQIKRIVRVEVKTSDQIHEFEVFAATSEGLTDVTSHFRHAGRDRWVGTLRRGRDLELGVNHLYFTAVLQDGSVAHQVRRFKLARRGKGLVRLSRPEHRPLNAPVGFTLKMLNADSFLATMNGRDVRTSFVEIAPGRWQAQLAAHDGVRHGRNVLIVTGISQDGDIYERKRAKFFVRRNQPVVGAGVDLIGRVGIAAPLDGSATRPAPRRGQLNLLWRLVGAPEGSGAALINATSVQPDFVPDLPGRYQIELAASHPRTAVVTDQIQLVVQPNTPPSGVPIETIVSTSNPGVQVGGTFYPMAIGGWMQLLVLDGKTLAKISDQTFYEIDSFTTALAGVPSDALAIMSGNGGLIGVNATIQQILTLEFSFLPIFGYTQLTSNSASDTNNLLAGSWSMIGRKGLPGGQSYQFVGLKRNETAPAGAMKGFLQEDSTGSYTFNWPPEFNSFDTMNTQSSQSQLVIEVGTLADGIQIPANTPGFVFFAFEADALTQGQLKTLAFDYYEADKVDCTDLGTKCLVQLADELNSLAQNDVPAIVFLMSQQKPTPTVENTGWIELANAIRYYGGNGLVLLSLDGSGDYSLVGLGGAGNRGPNQGVEVNQSLTGAPSARITGLLTRNRQGLYEARLNAPPDGINNESVYPGGLQAILAQPAQGFPPFSSPGPLAAVTFIANNIGFAGKSSAEIRDLYWLDTSIDWGVKQSDLNGIRPCTANPCASSFDAVRRQLSSEFGAVAQVRQYLTGGDTSDLSQIMNQAYGDTSFGFVAISSEILKTYNPPSGGTKADSATKILSASLSIATGLTGPIPVVGSSVSGSFEVAQGTVNLMDALGVFKTAGTGTSPFDPSAFEGDIYSLGMNLEDAFKGAVDGLSRVADLIVSDWGRLQAANTKILTPGSQGGWGLDSTTTAMLTSQLQTNLAAYIWETLLPVPFIVAQCEGAAPTGDLCNSGIFRINPPQYARFPMLAPSPTQNLAMYTTVAFRSEGNNTVYPEQNDIDHLFGNGGLGLHPLYFFALANTENSMSDTPTSPGFTCFVLGNLCYPVFGM